MANKIIAIEGIDGSGKTTVAKRLAEKTGGYYMHTPGSEFENIKNIFEKKEGSIESRFFFYVSSLWDAHKKALAIVRFKPVIIDRYMLSTLCYHKVLLGICRSSLNIDGIPENIFPPEADINIVLDIPDLIAERRIRARESSRFDNKLEKDRLFQKAVANEYRMTRYPSVRVYGKSIDEIVNECLGIINENKYELRYA